LVERSISTERCKSLGNVARLLLPVVPRGLGFDQAFEPVGERAAIFLRQFLGRISAA
jgi:hypothetical protein